MKKSGVLRRVVILVAFAWAYAHFVLGNGLLIQDPQWREYLHWFLYAAVAWGVITLFADRIANRRDNSKEEPYDHTGKHTQ